VDAHTHSPNNPKRFQQTSARKLMTTVFWDRKGMLIVEFMQQGTKISKAYCKVLKKLHRASQSEQKAWNADIRCSVAPRQCVSTYSC
jgi:hypothetical protein